MTRAECTTRRLQTLAAIVLVTAAAAIASNLSALLDGHAAEVAMGLLFSPISVTFGGGMVEVPGNASRWFLVGGLLFWPLFALLAWRYGRTRSPALLVALFAWCCQGFVQIAIRFGGIMSV